MGRAWGRGWSLGAAALMCLCAGCTGGGEGAAASKTTIEGQALLVVDARRAEEAAVVLRGRIIGSEVLGRTFHLRVEPLEVYKNTVERSWEESFLIMVGRGGEEVRALPPQYSVATFYLIPYGRSPSLNSWQFLGRHPDRGITHAEPGQRPVRLAPAPELPSP